jgi:hypothetical protein
MTTGGSPEDSVLIPRSEYRSLLRESRQVELLGYLIAAMGIGAALLLLNAGDASFWVVVFGAIGFLAALWAFTTGRRHAYRTTRGTVPPPGAGGIPYVDRHVRPGFETPTHLDSGDITGN